MRCKFKIATKKARKALIVLKLITFLIRREKSKWLWTSVLITFREKKQIAKIGLILTLNRQIYKSNWISPKSKKFIP